MFYSGICELIYGVQIAVGYGCAIIKRSTFLKNGLFLDVAQSTTLGVVSYYMLVTIPEDSFMPSGSLVG